MTNVAVVGAGHWGPHLIRNFEDHLDSSVHWVVEQDDARRRAISRRFPNVEPTAHVGEALADREVDAVVIATPTSTHASLAAAALEAGKHVLVEKPITNSLSEAVKLCRLADSRSLVLHVGHTFLFNPAFTTAKNYIESGQLGEVNYLSLTRTNLGPVRRDVNAAWDLAAHDVSIANHWLESLPAAVSAVGGSWLNPGVEDAVFATLTYPYGVLVHIEASWLSPLKRRLVTVIGSDRMLTVDDMDFREPIRVYNKGVVGTSSDEIADTFAGFRSQIWEGEVIIPHVAGDEPLKAECDAFLRRIAGKGSRLSDGWFGARVVAVLEAMGRSMVEGGAMIEVESP